MTFEPSPTAREMADALRAGVSARLRAHEAATPDEDLARLRALGALEDVPPSAKPTLFAPLVRALRRVLRGLFRPWLAAQTAFNREIADVAVETAVSGNALSRRLAVLEQGAHELQMRLRSLESGHGAPPPAPGMASLDRETLLRMIVQSRIRRPPMRVLVCGPRAVARDLGTFGFDVVHDPAGLPEAEPETQAQPPGGRGSATPFNDVFGVVVWLAADVSHGGGVEPAPPALSRLVEPGGQVIAGVTAGRAGVAFLIEGLVAHTVVTAIPEEHGWRVTEHGADAAPAVLAAVNPGVLTVIVAERPHASGR